MARSMSDQLASARARRAARPSPMRRANPMGARASHLGLAQRCSPGYHLENRAPLGTPPKTYCIPNAPMSNPGKACSNPEGACCSDCAKSAAARAGNPSARSRNPYALIPPRFGGYWGGGWGYNGWTWPSPYAYAYRRPVFVAAPRVVRPHPSRVLAASVAPYYYGYNGWGGFASPVVF